jgi:hypothetical protein
MQQNPDREYFMEESFPIASLYPHMEPAGPILRIRAEPIGVLNDALVRNDRKYWEKLCAELIGDWIKEETSVEEVCSFAIERYLRKQVEGFAGNPDYLRDPNAPKAFSKLRSAIASVYNWRAENADNENDRQRMIREADFGFRQALALCPYSPEAIWRYHTLLTSQGKTDEAGLVLQTAQKFAPHDPQLREWLKEQPATER